MVRCSCLVGTEVKKGAGKGNGDVVRCGCLVGAEVKKVLVGTAVDGTGLLGVQCGVVAQCRIGLKKNCHEERYRCCVHLGIWAHNL